MGGSLNYEKDYARLVRSRNKSPGELTILRGVKLGFPACKGTYPDCPEIPNKDEKPCRSCPVMEALKEKGLV
jgi:hypothetical protein